MNAIVQKYTYDKINNWFFEINDSHELCIKMNIRLYNIYLKTVIISRTFQ